MKIRFLVAALIISALAGCTQDQNLDQTSREQTATIQSLNQELKRVNAELEDVMAQRSDFEKAKAGIEKKMQKEMAAGDLSVGMEERGLIVTVLDRILFDSGQVQLKSSAFPTLDKLSQVLQVELPENMVYIEGHTDNEPIRFSAWRSNWELSTARALEVLHYFIEAGSLNPKRLAATGYGEFHPTIDNNSPEGKSGNRRVEIVVSHKKIAE